MIEIEFLKKFPLFTGLNDAQIKKLISIITVAEYQAGSIIVRDGDRGDEMFLLLKGDVEITKQMVIKMETMDSSAKDKSLLRLSADFHTCFGELALIEEKSERSATVSAINACKVGVISRDQFYKLVEGDHELGFVIFRNLSRIVSERLKRASKDILKLTTAFVLAVEK